MESADTQRKLQDIFSKGVSEYIDPEGAFSKRVLEKTNQQYPHDIIVKWGADPSRPDIHLGHAVILRKLRQLQDLGCKVVFLIGDYTAMIGDPTGKSKVRPEIDQREIEKNMKTYVEQVGKILRLDKSVFSWIRNSDWYHNVTDMAPPAKTLSMTFERNGEKTTFPIGANSFVGKALYFESTRMQKTHLGKQEVVGVTMWNVLWTMRKITHSRLVERDMFQERFKRGEELYMHEMLYPVLQGIDSEVMTRIYGSCDLEIGGSDQTFNMLLGRDVMKMSNRTPQAVLCCKILPGTDGKEKMSKSLDNYISITDEPNDMFGKVMSIPDHVIPDYFELCTYRTVEDVEDIRSELSSGANPRDMKWQLAKEIVSMYHGSDAAASAEKHFSEVFQKGGIPEELPEISLTESIRLADVLTDLGIVSSKTEFKRLVDEGAIKNAQTDEKISEYDPSIENGTVLKVGKKHFFKVRTTNNVQKV